MAKDQTPFEALDPEDINHMTLCAHFTRDKQLLCIASAIEIESIACELLGPMTKAVRQDLAERLLVITKAQRALMVDRAADISAERLSLASAGVTESVLNWCVTEYAG